ncbi:MAG: hypothetical protein IPO43_04635 [Rhodoferax sp.]|nr:hypothetical protein [Rhodoferax sp.]
METSTVSDEEILRGLRRAPQIRNRIASMLAVAQGTSEEFRRADDAEDWLIQEIRGLGPDTLQALGPGPSEQTEQEVRHTGRAHREGKKN